MTAGSSAFEVGTSALLRAFHVIPGVDGPEGTLHPHLYRIELVVGRTRLDDRGMVCDLDVLTASLRRVISELDGIDLERIRPDDADAVTVEVLARSVHRALSEPIRLAGGETLAVRVWESETEFGGYRGPVG